MLVENVSVISFADGYAFTIMMSEVLVIFGLLILIIGIHLFAKTRANSRDEFRFRQYATSIAVGVCGVAMFLGSFFIS